MTPRPLRVLFLMQHQGNLRKFESMLHALAGRTHRVRVACGDNPRKAAPPIVERLAGHATFSFDADLPELTESWGFHHIANWLRQTLSDLRHLSPRYARFSTVRDDARRHWPAPVLWTFLGVQRRFPGWTRTLRAFVLRLELAVPIRRSVVRYLQRERPDVLLVTPLVAGWFLGDYVRAASRLGIPTCLAVASWDNLTTKGVLSAPPDRMIVWNESQRTEAGGEFQYPLDRVTVTGAHLFDLWFTTSPRDRRDFCRRAGLDPERRYVLYVGSSGRIARKESDFVDEWIHAIRQSDDPRIRELAVLVRPHFQNPDAWRDWQPSDALTTVFPIRGEEPITDAARADYFDAMFHGVAVVGLNTTALIEAGIVGRPVLSVVTSRFGQEGMPHFHYLVDHGLLRVSRDFSEHRRQLAEALDRTSSGAEASAGFIQAFVRPCGRDDAAAPKCATAVEEAATATPGELDRTPRGLPRVLWTALLAMLAVASAPALAVHLLRRGRRRRRAAAVTPERVEPARRLP